MRILGLDTGIASVGWALIETPDSSGDGRIIDSGTWMFDAPEEKSQTGIKLKSELRRIFRGRRRVIRRRRMRMNEVRRILHRHGLLPSADRDALKQPGLNPWTIRAEALDRMLRPVEFAVALGHMARHRGFKSNAKGAKTTDQAKEDSKMKKAMADMREKLAHVGTPAKLLTQDNDFVLRQTKMKNGDFETVRRFRNREGEYSRSLLRGDLATEVRALFRAQAKLQSDFAKKEFEEEFINAAFFQRPLQDGEKLVGPCPFEPDQKRSPKLGYSFELFRFLSRLNHLTLQEGKKERGLAANEIRTAAVAFGATEKFTFAALRKKLKLPETTVFDGVKPDDEKNFDIVARSGAAAAGTARLHRAIGGALGELAWEALIGDPKRLDKISEIVTFRSDLDRMRGGLQEAQFDAELIETIIKVADSGALDVFTGVGHISAKAARNIIPGLLQGRTYDKACALAGYDHTASRERDAFDVGAHGKDALKKILQERRISRELVGSPTARKALIEAVKQVKAIVERYGVPDRVHVELARSMGKSIEERREIQLGNEKRKRQKDKLRELFQEEVGQALRDGQPGAEELLRFELWNEQNGRCLYTDSYICPRQLVASDDSVQVDHILPWSRFGDDSFTNKSLCTAKANQDKKGRTPYEWFKDDKPEVDWEAFVARVESIQYMKGFKKRNYKLRNAAEAAEKFRNRNLNDTRWTCRLLAEALNQIYDKDEGARRVFARPGPLTDRLRRAWGLQWFKKNEKGERVPDDRHHALDAIIVAATTESLLQRATREVQEIETKGLPYDLMKNVAPPWPGFREQALAAVERVFVARAERRRARGKAHDATIRHIAVRNGEQKVYERKKVASLELSDLERVKDADRNVALIDSLRRWMEAGRPKDNPPLSPKGDPISKVRLVTKSKVNITLNTGSPDRLATVDRGEMARVDVFRKPNRKGKSEYYLVPIYPHEIATLDKPPMRAVQGGGDESKWPQIDQTFEFLWSINQLTLLEVTKPDGEVIRAYLRSIDRNTGAITVSGIADSTDTRKGIGTRKLFAFKKLQVDRLGHVFEVQRELRTWLGKVCI